MGAGLLSNVIYGSDGDAPLCSFPRCHCCYTTTPLTRPGCAQLAHSPDPSHASLTHWPSGHSLTHSTQSAGLSCVWAGAACAHFCNPLTPCPFGPSAMRRSIGSVCASLHLTTFSLTTPLTQQPNVRYEIAKRLRAPLGLALHRLPGPPETRSPYHDAVR